MTAIADTIDELTPEWFTGALREGGALGDGASVASADSRLIGTGQLGLVAQSELGYDGAADGAPGTVVVKLPHTDEGSRQMGVMMGVYEAEVRFYEDIAPLVEITTPRAYWGDLEPASGRFTLVLEDLSPFAEVGDAVAGGTLEQAELAIRTLPGLHAPCWDSAGLDSHTWLTDLTRTGMLFGAVEALVEPFAERFGDRVEPQHLALVRELGPKAASVMERAWQPPLVVAHGDYRLDNMMFGTGDGTAPIYVLDWQAAKLGPPLLDAAIYLGSCLSVEDRRANERELLGIYREELEAAGVGGFTFEDCWESYRRSSLYPFLLAISVSMTLERTERGDEMWASMIRNCAELVSDLDAAAILD